MEADVPNRLNILVVHQDALVSAGLVAALRQYQTFEVFIEGIDTASSDGTRIDVVIADYGQAMHLTGTASHAARGTLATARILVLTSNDREVDIRRAVEAGVHGYLLLGSSLGELVEGVTVVARGMRYLSRSVAQRMADSLTRETLTSREIEVLQLVADGDSNKAIARRLQIEIGTVKSHMTAIMAKLCATSRTQAAGIAATRGLVQVRGPYPHPGPHPGHLALQLPQFA